MRLLCLQWAESETGAGGRGGARVTTVSCGDKWGGSAPCDWGTRRRSGDRRPEKVPICSQVSLSARTICLLSDTIRPWHMFSVHMTGAHCLLVTMWFISWRFPVAFLKSKLGLLDHLLIPSFIFISYWERTLILTIFSCRGICTHSYE